MARRRRVLFIDTICPKPYWTRTLAQEALGGTEATVIRVADSLAKSHDYDVVVTQHNRERTEWAGPGTARYSKYTPHKLLEKWDAVVIIRDTGSLLLKVREQMPSTPIYLWLHDLATDTSVGLAGALAIEKTQPVVITVSDYHKTQVVEYLKSKSVSRFPKVRRIYNPVVTQGRDNCSMDHDRLIFFSSPHKGLDYAVRTFKNLLNFKPHLRLWVANPGYLATPDLTHPNIDVLGPLPHAEALKHVEASFCVWYPNYVFPETFGLVLAEANAVGTPVLAHDIGAASEVLEAHAGQLVDARNPKTLIDKFLRWHDGGRPVVKANELFSLDNVTAAWHAYLT